MKEDVRGFGRLETLKVFGPVGQTIIQSYGRRGSDENFARGTGTFRSLHGGRMPAFARCCFCIAASRLVFTSPMACYSSCTSSVNGLHQGARGKLLSNSS